MKIKTRQMTYDQVMALPGPVHRDPLRPPLVMRWLVYLISLPTMWATRFILREERMELVKGKPCLILMNHSAFMDIKFAYRIFTPRPLCVVGAGDALIGREWIMRLMGYIPTRKYATDLTLLQDMRYAMEQRKASVLMFPEACYTLDGRVTLLPRHFGAVLKRLRMPVVMVNTHGIFARRPIYNDGKPRKCRTEAFARVLFTPEELKEKSVQEIDEEIDRAFSFDQFDWQHRQQMRITAPARADGLNRLLFQCAHCGTLGSMEGKGETLTCAKCGKTYHLTELGQMKALSGETEFPRITDWFDWQREQVRKEIDQGAYALDTEVSIGILKDYKALYMVGEGRLRHDAEGFTLTGCDGKLEYRQGPTASHSVNADYAWYGLGDILTIGTNELTYVLFPKKKDVVARIRLAAEILYQNNKA